MSNNQISVSKDDILSLAREVYKQAVCGYSDLEDSVCISEVNRFFDHFLKSQKDSTSNLTVSPNLYEGNSVIWTTVPTQGSSYYIGCDPGFSTFPSYSSSANEGFSNPADRQLLLFDDTNSSTSTVVDLSGSFDVSAGDESPPGQINSNEGHVFHNF